MPALIQANRQEVSRQFPVMGFTIRTGISPAWIEVAVASDPTLFFGTDAKSRRTSSNFYSSRAVGLLPAEKGEAVYLIPPTAMARFVGQSRLYYALAVYSQPNFSNPEVVRIDPKAMPYIRISNTFSGNNRRLMEIPNRRMGSVNNGKSYAENGDRTSLEWGGDIAEPGEIERIINEKPTIVSSSDEPDSSIQPATESQSVRAFVYDDGYDDSLWYSAQDADGLIDSDAGDPYNEPIPEEIPSKELPSRKTLSPEPEPPLKVLQIPLDPGKGGRSIDQQSLIAGDLILTTTQSWTATGIRFVTGSAVSHAILYIGNGNIVEAYSQAGVVQRTLAEALKDASLAVAYRIPDITNQQVQKAVAFAQQQVGKEYGGWTALVAGILSPSTSDLTLGPSDKTFICSELVLAAYHHAGIAITYGLPERSDAGDIARVALKRGLKYVGHLIADDAYTHYVYANNSSTLSSVQGIVEEGDDRGFEGPILTVGDIPVVSEEQSYSMAFVEPEYPQASRFAPAHPDKYTPKTDRQINRIVIHITDSSAKATTNGMVRWLQKKDTTKVSAHYVIGRDGEVVQMVKHKDKAWHANRANRDSIGIEHIANTTDSPPTEAQYCASAALVRWLADTYGIPLDRQHILGHVEADSSTTHKDCPNAVWDWDYYMGMVISGTCYLRSTTQPSVSTNGMQSYVPMLSGQSFDVTWQDVSLLPQPTAMSCWAAAAAMIVGWRDRLSISAKDIVMGQGPWATYQNGLNPKDVPTLASSWKLVVETPRSYAISELRQMLEQNGPLWIGEATPSLHVVVMAGLYGDGTIKGTHVRVLDPWPVGQGSTYDLPFQNFIQQYEQATAINSVNIQVLHAGGREDSSNHYSHSQQALEGVTSAIAGAVITRILDNKGDITWKLSQLKGIKYPADQKKNAGSASYKEQIITVKGPRLGTVGGLDEIYVDSELSFQYNGRSLGNVSISITKANDAVGAGLNVEASIMNDANVYQEKSKENAVSEGFAAIKVRFHYRFTNVIYDDRIAITDLVLFGNGMHNISYRWTQP
ncbi:MAG: N-acetylmuramoyl-L-alanine amidase [Cyanobacteria bacterium P01_D01_bin.156]